MRQLIVVTTLALVICTPTTAQPALRAEDLPYWPAAERDAYIDYESDLNAIPDPQRLRAWHDLLASEPHIATTPGDRKVIDAIASAFNDMGLDVEVHPFWAYIPMPIDAAVEIVEPEHVVCGLREQELPADPYSRLEGLTLGWSAYSGSGDVTAEVVYANFGRKEDFERLASLGVSCAGKIVITRFGGNYRGYKAKFAQDAGAAAVIIYTDPADAGYVQGLMYPEGGYADGTCIQRGSIKTLPYIGDPLTPFVEATEDAERLDPDSLDLPRIPVQPVGWQVAETIMSRMNGEAVPREWQGGLPFTYRLSGGSGLKVRVMVEQELAIRPTCNVIGTLKGATNPDEMVIIGAHHDAWNCGAADPTCGTICVMEAARAFSHMARDGRRPARSMLFCAWGAEEFGIIGSSEWVEARRDALVKSAIAYINLDMAVMGPDFGSSASPSLRKLIAEAARSVPQARDPARSVFEAWAGDEEPRFGDLGGGSDYVAFLCHAGVPSCSLGGSGAKGTSYHTNYDTLAWYRKVVGDDYEPNLMVTRMTCAVASRLANAPLLPLDPIAAPRLAHAELEALRHDIESSSASDEALQTVQLARVTFDRVARTLAFDQVHTGFRIESGDLSGDRLAAHNRLLIGMDRAWLDEAGLPDRPWFRSLLSAPDEDSGYAAWVLPGVRQALGRGDPDELAAAAEALLAVARRLEELTRAFRDEP